MEFKFNNDIHVKITLARFMQLEKEFNDNYNNLAREFFANLDKDSKLELLNKEFTFDKQIAALTGGHHRIFQGFMKANYLPYIYAPSFSALSAYPDIQTHIRHNAYRTISAMLLNNCSFEEKVIILSKSLGKKYFKDLEILDITTCRLNSLMNMLNSHTL